MKMFQIDFAASRCESFGSGFFGVRCAGSLPFSDMNAKYACSSLRRESHSAKSLSRFSMISAGTSITSPSVFVTFSPPWSAATT